MSQIIHLAQARPKAMLKRLKRLTGLDFEQIPESLLDAGPVSGGYHPEHAGKKRPALRAGARRMGNDYSSY